MLDLPIYEKEGLVLLVQTDHLTGETIGTDVAGQAEQACKTIGEILTANDLTFEDVVKTTCFITDMADFGAFNEVYAKYFVSKPARSCVAVKELPKSILCEIEVIAAAK